MKVFILLLALSSYLLCAKVEFLVLGSGGPELDARASTSYVLLIDNKAKLIIDMGSGSMLGFEKHHLKIEDLDAVVLTHLHIDHAVDLPSYVKAGFFTSRTKPLEIIAPKGNEFFPSTDEYLENLFGKSGAYRYMNDVLSVNSDSFELIPRNIHSGKITTKKYKDFTLQLIRVHHGIVPALALRINVGDKSILISGDTNNQDKNLERIAKGADLFVAHHAIAKGAQGYATQLHMQPHTIAEIASKAHVSTLLLTHRMKRTLGQEDKTRTIIKRTFQGKILFGEDSMKILIR